GNRDGMGRAAGIAGLELALPIIQRSPAARRSLLAFICNVVRPPAKRVGGVNRETFPPRQKAEADREVRAVAMSDTPAERVGLVDRWSDRHGQRVGRAHETGPSGGTCISVSRDRP